MKTFIALCFLLASSCAVVHPVAVGKAAGKTITFTPDLTSGNGQVAVTLTWSTTPVANDCTATGAWTGPRAAFGSELQPPITQSATYMIACSWAADSKATLSWTAPTTNTDASALTDLAGYRIYRQLNGVAPWTDLATISDPLVLTYVDAGLVPNTYGYTVTAVNSVGIQSEPSNVVTKTITATGESVSEQVAITVNQKPSPPLAQRAD
jgi:hypothetical protein